MARPPDGSSEDSWSTGGGPSPRLGLHDGDDLADPVLAIHRVPHGQLGIERVRVASAVARAFEVAGFDQVGHDALGRALGDPDGVGDIADANARIPGDAQQYMRVISQERPALHAGSLARDATNFVADKTRQLTRDSQVVYSESRLEDRRWEQC